MAEHFVNDRQRHHHRASLNLAVTKRCEGVDLDNVREYANGNGLGLTKC